LCLFALAAARAPTHKNREEAPGIH
jgi:hypothetical protein